MICSWRNITRIQGSNCSGWTLPLPMQRWLENLLRMKLSRALETLATGKPMHFRSDENRKPEITYVFAGHWNSSECVKLTLLIHFEIFCNLFPKRHLLWGKFFNSSCWSFILRPYSSQKNQANIIFKTARHERMLLKRGRRSLNDARLLSMQTMILRSVTHQ